MRPIVWAIGATTVVFIGVGIVELERFRRAGRYLNYERMEEAARHLRWVNRSNAEAYRGLGQLAFDRGSIEAAERNFDRSLDI